MTENANNFGRRPRSMDYTHNQLHGLSIKFNEYTPNEDKRTAILRQLSLVQSELSALAKTNNERISNSSTPTSPTFTSPVLSYGFGELSKNQNRLSGSSFDSSDTLVDESFLQSPLTKNSEPISNEMNRLMIYDLGLLRKAEEPDVATVLLKIRADFRLLFNALKNSLTPPEWFHYWVLSLAVGFSALYVGYYFNQT